MTNKITFILASASPRRKELLGHLKIPFQIKTLNVPEESQHSDPIEFCREIAIIKGEVVFDLLKSDLPSLLVVSADTIVSLDEKIYGKPKDLNEAKKILNELSGRTHSVFTAVAMKAYHQGQIFSHSFVEESKVTFNSISPELMERYLATGDSLDKAGAYGIQGPSLTFISKVEGCYANVVGFPLSRFVIECDQFLKPFHQGRPWFSLF